MKIAKLNIEGYIGELDEQSVFAGEKNFSLNHLKTFLNNLSSDVTDIHYKVNSGGGSVWDGWDMRDALIASGKKLTAVGEGIVGSIATVVFMAASVENRSLIRGTKFFVHHPYWLPDEPEPMRANELIALGKDLKVEQDRILNFYTSQTNASAEYLQPLMAKETSLSSEDAVKLGFASKEIEETEFVDYREYKLVAFIKPKEKPKTDKMEKGVLDQMNKFFNKLNKVIKGKFYDTDIMTVNDAGTQVTLMVESDTEDITNAPAFIVDADGNRVEAPDGNYTDENGKVIKVVAGKVAEVVAKVIDSNEPTVEALKAELEASKAENETLKQSIQASKEEAEAVKANFTKIETEFKALKNIVIGEGAEFDEGKQEFKASRKSALSTGNEAFLNEMAGVLKKKK